MAGNIDATDLGQSASAGGSRSGTGEVSGLTLEQVREELNLIKDRLEAGGEPLESALELWERQEALAAYAQGHLDEFRTGHEMIINGESADFGSASVDVSGLSIEQIREELNSINEQLAAGVPVETAHQLFLREEALAARCRELLAGVGTRIAEAKEARSFGACS